MEKFKRFIDCALPAEACNLRCHYCYITQQKKFNNKITPLDHSVTEIRYALSKSRLGGICLINLCANGETLLPQETIDIIYALLEEGHFVMVVTNGTPTKKFEIISTWPKEYLSRLFFKFSFHFLEFKRLNLFDVFFNNVNLMKASGASFTVELTPSDELIPYIDEIKSISLEKLGAYPHATIARDNRTAGIDVLSNYSLQEYVKIWSVFKSDLLDFKSKIFLKKRHEFCYAGDWSLFVDLSSGNITPCNCHKSIGNIYDIAKPINFRAINHCTIPHCFNGHAWLALGNIPNMKTPTYAELRNRICTDGTEWLQPRMKAFMSSKLRESNKEYSIIQKFLLAAKDALSKCLNIYRSFHHYLFLKKKFLKTWLHFRVNAKPKFIVVGSPTHTNLGDSAITIAQINFLKKIDPGHDSTEELTFSEYNKDRKLYKKAISPKSVICGLGGGNMGNQWPEEELFRQNLIKDFPNNPIIIFPQTIFYLDNKTDGIKEESIKLYNNHLNLTLVAREQKSFEIMKELYPQCKVLLVPDIVLSSSKNDFGVMASERNGVLLCLRSDAERKINDSKTDKIIEYLKLAFRKTDMYSDCEVTKENRAECLRKKMQEFCGAKLVITDRLHGMIFAAVSETPAIVIGNYNHKVSGSYEWIKSLPYIKFADSIDEVLTEIPEMLKIQSCTYDNSALSSYFDLLADEVKAKCRKSQ
ncbi:polysaccharide pyruvyl transferase family protein [bacterium]|nr:polysaccharide pyruvyl transferase family protein [bacterium]